MTKKLEHIKKSLMLYEENIEKDVFSKMKIYPNSIPLCDNKDIDISTQIMGIKLETPFYINAMTGGIDKSIEINEKLSYIASKTNLLFFTGSYAPALKNECIESYSVVKKYDIKYGANIGIDKSLQDMRKIIDILNPQFLQVHVNAMQEYLMIDGVSNFGEFRTNFEKLQNLNTNIILKEIGLGMNKETVKMAIDNNIKCVDISGSGGTNFLKIENSRNKTKFRYEQKYLEEWGMTTLESLLDVKEYVDDIDILASGGIKNPLQIVKALILGAKAVGISAHFLYLIDKYDVDEVVAIVEQYKEDIKMIMNMLGAKNITELRKVRYKIGEKY